MPAAFLRTIIECPCKVFFLLFQSFFPLLRFRGRPLATYYLYLRYFNILLWMGRGIGRFCLWGGSGCIFMIYLVFFSVIVMYFVFFCGDFPQNSVMIKTVLGESIALNYLFFRRLLYSTYFLTECWCHKVVTLVISFCC